MDNTYLASLKGRSQVPDPWGEDMESYRAVFTMIDSATDGLINFLKHT